MIVGLRSLLPELVLGPALLAISLGADTVGSIFRAAILQLEVPDELRGRLNAIDTRPSRETQTLTVTYQKTP